MGGTTIVFEEDGLLGLLKKLAKHYEDGEFVIHPLTLDGVTIMHKQGKKWESIGNQGIEKAVAMTYGKEPTKEWAMLCHFGK